VDVDLASELEIVGADGVGVDCATALEGVGMRVTGVAIGLTGFVSDTGLIKLLGGGIRVTGVAISRGGGIGANVEAFGTGGIGAVCATEGTGFGVAPVRVTPDVLGGFGFKGCGIVVTGVVSGLGVAGTTGVETDVVACAGVVEGVVLDCAAGVAGVLLEAALDVPKRLAALMYCANAACCSGVAVLFATAVNIALNSGLFEAISVRACTVSAFD